MSRQSSIRPQSDPPSRYGLIPQLSSSSSVQVASSVGAITTTLGSQSLVVPSPSPIPQTFLILVSSTLSGGAPSGDSVKSSTLTETSTQVSTAMATSSFTSVQGAPPLAGTRRGGGVGKGEVAGIIVGCLAAGALVALAFVMCRKRRRSGQPARILSVSTLSTEPLSGATWSDLIPSPRGQHAEEYSTMPTAGTSSSTAYSIQTSNATLNGDVQSEKATLQIVYAWHEPTSTVELESDSEEIGLVDGENGTEDAASEAPSEALPPYSEGRCPAYRY